MNKQTWRDYFKDACLSLTKAVEATYINSGSYGAYYKLDDETGVKVLLRYKSFSANEAQLIACNTYEIVREYESQAKAYEIMGNYTPKPIELIAVYCENSKCYYPAILMEHFEGKNASELPVNEISEIEYKASKILNQFGICKDDTGAHNILVNDEGEICIIDWGFGATFGHKQHQIA